VAKLTLVSMTSNVQVDELRETALSLGYDLCAIPGDDWLQADTICHRQPTVLFFDCAYHKKDDLVSVLSRAGNRSILGIFKNDNGYWDDEILNHCGDFLSWPCSPGELAMRLARVLCANSSAVSICDETASVKHCVSLNMLGNSRRFMEAVKLLNKFARCDAPVLIEGETGTGKELAARAIHYLGTRRDQPFISVSCGAIPDNLIENELFGHERGAFTDAKDKQPGLIAQADGGTLFLDEVDTLSAKGQITLLRFLETLEYKPLGGKCIKTANVRIIAATNSDLRKQTNRELFRQDLLFRLDVLSIQLPALRHRDDDVKLLAEHFINECGARYQQHPKPLHPDTLEWMRRYHWPGNVRELEHLIHREFLLAEGPVISIPDKHNGTSKPASSRGVITADVRLRDAKANLIADFEKSYLCQLMATAKGNVTLAAKRAGKERRALGKLLKKHGIEKTTWSSAPQPDTR
jgi:DNA-binding NtrC family response regulator